jgi:hypothetical protein
MERSRDVKGVRHVNQPVAANRGKRGAALTREAGRCV